MTKNKFPVLIKILEEIQDGRKGLKTLREEITPPAQKFNAHIVHWLESKNYPLRKGAITKADDHRIDDLYDQTPTERLHPGSPSLAIGQKFRIRKQRGVMALRVVFENIAEHAGYFFGQPKSFNYPIYSSKGRLAFQSGKPLPWHPPLVRKWSDQPGHFFPLIVEHPGHMDYGLIVLEMFNQRYRSMFNKAIRTASKKIGIDKISKALDG
jgi:hypothetical protein